MKVFKILQWLYASLVCNHNFFLFRKKVHLQFVSELLEHNELCIWFIWLQLIGQISGHKIVSPTILLVCCVIVLG